MSTPETTSAEPSPSPTEATVVARDSSVVDPDATAPSAAIADARALRDALVTRGRGAATAAVRGARGGLREAERRLDEADRRWDERADQAALPDVHGKDPIDDLAIRIDRESDYWRTFAVRSLRPGAARNLAIAGAALALSSGLALGILGTLAAAFGSSGPGTSALTTSGGVAVCAVVACVLGVVSERGRVHAAREALTRADQAERRLERVAAILALKHASPTRYVEALTRLERER